MYHSFRAIAQRDTSNHHNVVMKQFVVFISTRIRLLQRDPSVVQTSTSGCKLFLGLSKLLLESLDSLQSVTRKTMS